MRMKSAHVTKYRSIRDSDLVEIEFEKTILVGPNEAGKTAFLQALQQLRPPGQVRKLDPLRDYPRSEYNDITTKRIDPKDVTVVIAEFVLEDSDKELVSAEFHGAVYVRGRRIDNAAWHDLRGGPTVPTYGDIKKDLLRLAAHVDSRVPEPAAGAQKIAPSAAAQTIVQGWLDSRKIAGESAETLNAWLKGALQYVDAKNAEEESRYDRLDRSITFNERRNDALKVLDPRTPIFVLFSNYFRVRPLIHLEHLAQRIEGNLLDDASYDYGNKCLLQLLGFSARELSNLGKAPEPPAGNVDALKHYRDQLDARSYQLNAASVRLTEGIRSVWLPDAARGEADRLRIVADGQYLKVVVEDDLGVEIELDQRSEGFQWLVSFFIVFFAEASGQHKNAILLLDEPGLSLHGLKQRDFRETISRLAKSNQTIYTTHSPFLVGPDELDLVRVVEMTDRRVGTKIHATVTAQDPAALLPLQEALGYDLAQSLFGQQRNLILEGLTDYWYVDAVSELLRTAKLFNLPENIALVPANAAGKVVYFATILHAQRLKVAALLDSDAAGEQAAHQEVLAHTLGNKAILRTRDAYRGAVKAPEIEDTLRTTLVGLAKADLGWDVEAIANAQTERPILDIFAEQIADFSKYRLAKAFLRWTRAHEAADLTGDEREQWIRLLQSIARALE
jgi:AAA ATPase-like protein